ncbi:hypothetical protein O181_038214 [Austropuccinia psidii MF-1]|uniref:Uncharacterized protein n=1 Tax=Austropuccinia psidii MF-1 TaxID=1389203 RepID=A0A9Q3D7X6_9BASI|nr:hypothetical protein [Austropuccinia psidii MF-1]
MPATPLSHRPNPQRCLPSLHSCSALTLALYHEAPHLCPHHSLHFRNPTLSSLLLTILMLLLPPQDMPPTLPSTPLMPHPLCPLQSLRLRSALQKFLRHYPYMGLILNTAYHPHTPAVR